MAKDTDLATATINHETAAVLMAILKKNNIILRQKDYEIMSELDGNRGPSGFNHMFRPIKARAEQLMSKFDDDAVIAPIVKARPKATKNRTATPPASDKKRKSKSTKSDAIKPEADETVETPTKKVKTEEDEGQVMFNEPSFFESAFQ